MASNGQHSWFWKKIGFWFVPVKRESLGPEEWQKIRRLEGHGTSQKARRFLMVGWLLIAMAGLWIGLRVAHQDGVAMGGFVAGAQLLFFCWGMWLARNNLAQISLEDRSVMEFGSEFEALKEGQRAQIFQRRVRETFWGRRVVDEHEADLRLHAQGDAFRLLRWILPGVVGICWLACFANRSSHSANFPQELAIGFTWVVVMVLATPVLVRMWTQADEPGEPVLTKPR
jgi:hypothetical protein